MKSHIITAAVAVLASLAGVSQFPIADTAPARQPAAVRPAQLQALKAQVTILDSRIVTLEGRQRANRAAAASGLRAGAILAKEMAALEASSNPTASEVDFQRSVRLWALADELDG